ncbi:MAG: hypothetical protein QM582_09995 [Micropruina sp.]|uniref:hypothetical protein n=1 Tax=Micropruina sp. TaxID=2737536 RepID=UPI0039E5B9EF
MRYLIVLLVVLAGCTQPVAPSSSPSVVVSGPPSVPSATPSPTCSPMGGTPTPCSQAEYEKTQEQNRLTEEAIALYRRWTKESTRLYRAGGTNKVTPEMKATTAGDFQKSALGVFQDLRAAGAKAVSGAIEIVTIGPNLGASAPLGSVAITACMDARSLKFENNGKHIRDGIAFIEYVVAKPIKGELMLWEASSEVVEGC